MSNMVVNTNVLALNSHRSLKTVGTAQSRASSRLSSGLKINSAADDAAGLAISEKMRAQIRGLDQASTNAQDAISLIQTAEGGMQEIDNMIQRIRELTVQASNDTNDQSTGDRTKIQEEINQLTTEIDNMAERVEFNKKKVINGAYADKTPVKAELKTLAELQQMSTDASKAMADAAASKTNYQGSLADANNSAISANISLADAGVSMASLLVSGQGGMSGIITLQGQIAIYDASQAEYDASKADYEAKIASYQAAYDAGNSDAGVSLGEAHASMGSLMSSVADLAASMGDLQASYVSAQASYDNYKFSMASYQNDADTAKIKAQTAQSGLDTAKTAYDEAQKAYFDAQKQIANFDAPADDPTDSTKTLYFQVGANSEQSLKLNIGSVKSDTLGIGDGSGKSSILVDEETGADITGLLDKLDAALSTVTTERAKLGAAQNRLEYTIKSLDISSENLSAAESRIRDTDMAKEMMNLTKSNVLQQAATSMLAQANQAPQSVLQLLG